MKIITFILCLTFFIISPLAQSIELTDKEKSFIKEKRIINVAVLSELNAKNDDVNKNDEYFDVSIDYIQAIALILDIQIKFTSYPSVDSIYESLRNNQEDIVAGFTPTEERLSHFIFSRPLFRSSVALGFSKEHSSKNLDLLNWTCIKDTVYCDIIENKGFKNIVKANNLYNAIDYINNNKADAIVDSYITLLEYVNKTSDVISNVKIMNGVQPFPATVMALKNNKTLIDIIDKVIISEEKNGTNNLESKSRYHQADLINIKSPYYTTNEKIIRFTMDPNSHPLFYENSSGDFFGYVWDVMNLIENRTNLKFKYIPLDNGKTPEAMLASGDIDAIPVIVNEYNDINKVSLSSSYISIKYISFHLSSGVSDSTSKVGVLLSDKDEEKYINSSSFGNDVQYFYTYTEMLSALDNNRIKQVFIPEGLSDLISAQQYTNKYEVSPEIYRTLDISMGVSVDDVELKERLDAAIKTLDEYEIKRIKRSYIKFEVNYGFNKLKIFFIFIVVFFVALICLLLFLHWSKKITTKVSLTEKDAKQFKDEFDLLDRIINGLPNKIFIHDENHNLLLNNCKELELGRCDKCLISKKNTLNSELISNVDEMYRVFHFDETIHKTIDVENCSLNMTSIDYFRKKITVLSQKRAYVLTVIRDVTAHKEQETALIKANTVAQQAIESRERFLASMSHELRTPIAGMSGLIEMLSMKTQDCESRMILDNISASTHHLHLLVNDILDFSKLDAEQLELDLRECHLLHEMGELLRLHFTTAIEKNLNFEFYYHPTIVDKVNIDPLRFSQIMNNLLSNAIKFTKKGQVSVEFKVDEKQICVDISDSGVGMTDEQQVKVFDPFVQADSTIMRQYGGTGLGLSIVKNLIDLMKGSLKIDSLPGLGTKISLSIPNKVVSSQVALSRTMVRYHGNNDYIQKWLDIWTKDIGKPVFYIDVFDNGQSMNGALDNPVIYLNSQLNEFKRTKGKLTELSSKPLFIDLLLDTLKDFDDHKETATATEVVPLCGNILVAEDNPINQLVIRKQLELLGLNITVVPDGAAALNLLLTSPDEFDLLITDCHMPIMDGFELANQVRENVSAFDDKAIIGCTAEDLRIGNERGRQYGFDAVLYKPYGMERMNAILCQYLKKATPTMNIIGTHNDAVGQWFFDLNIRDQEFMAPIFIESMQDDATLLSENITNVEVLVKTCHRIKGGASAVGAMHISEQANYVETIVRNEGTVDSHEIRKLISAIENEIDSLKHWKQRN